MLIVVITCLSLVLNKRILSIIGKFLCYLQKIFFSELKIRCKCQSIFRHGASGLGKGLLPPTFSFSSCRYFSDIITYMKLSYSGIALPTFLKLKEYNAPLSRVRIFLSGFFGWGRPPTFTNDAMCRNFGIPVDSLSLSLCGKIVDPLFWWSFPVMRHIRCHVFTS